MSPKLENNYLFAGLSYALSAPEASMLKSSLKDEGPPTIREDQPLLALSSSGSQGSAGQEPGATDHSAHSSSSCGGTSSSSAPVTQASQPSCCAHCLSLLFAAKGNTLRCCHAC